MKSFYISISLRGFSRSIKGLLIVFLLLLVFNGFKFDEVLLKGYLILVSVFTIISIALGKTFYLKEKTLYIYYFCLPFFKYSIALDRINKVEFYYHIKARDIAYLKIYFDENKSKKFHYDNITNTDIIAMARILEKEGVSIVLN